MKKTAILVLAATALSVAGPATAQDYITNNRYFACSRREDARSFASMLQAKDNLAMAKLVVDQRCVLLKGGDVVSVMERDSGLVKIRMRGETDGVWAPREAIDRVK